MAKNWQAQLHYDPVTPLLASGNEPIALFTARDLLDQPKDVKLLWNLPGARRLLNSQHVDGHWTFKTPIEAIRTPEHYNQLETYRNLGFLVELYGFDDRSESIRNAVDYLLSFQTDEGDIRGIYGNQYTPNYTAAILELLIKAGYTRNKRVEKVFEWLLHIRQHDGGWAIPFRTAGRKLDSMIMESDTVNPDLEKPHSHLVTGVVLRAFAAHERRRHSAASLHAARLLLSHLFTKDNYPDRGTPDYWLRFTFPFWFTDLISAMDSLSTIGITVAEPNMLRAQQWLIEHQQPSGLWSQLKILKNQKYEPHLWLSLAICRILKRLHQ